MAKAILLYGKTAFVAVFLYSVGSVKVNSGIGVVKGR